MNDGAYSSADSGPGVSRTLGQVWASAVQGLLLRLDLIVLEAREEKDRFLGFLLLGVLVALSGFMAFLMLNLAILLIAGEHQFAVLLVMLGFYSLLTLGLGLGMWRMVRSAPTPFAATVEEFKKDQAVFSEK